MPHTSIAVATGAALLASFSPAAAQDYPTKAVQMIVAYSPGGGTDTAARLIAKHAEEHLGQRLAVENRPGAGGQVGFTALANAESDGYHIGFINLPSIFLVKELRDNVPFEMSDFDAIAGIQLDPAVLAVDADSSYQSAEDLFADAREAETPLNIGADGPLSNNHLQLVVAEESTGVDMNFVPFDGSGPAITAALGGDVDAALPSASAAAPQVESGELRILGVFSDEPYEGYPDAPLVSEALGQEIPSVGASLRGVAAPQGTSEEHMGVLETAFADIVQDEDFREAADEAGMPLRYLTASEFSDYIETAESQASQYIELLE